jgi:hypothetical protein
VPARDREQHCLELATGRCRRENLIFLPCDTFL